MIVHNNFPLSEITYYKIGGKAKYLLEIQSEKDLFDCLNFVQGKSIENILPLGLGSNILISDKDFDGAVLKFTIPQNLHIEQLEEDLIKVFSSHHLDNVIQYGFEHGLTGLEWAGGLPSTVGAAVRGNVGAFGGEIGNVTEGIEGLERLEGKFVQKKLSKEGLRFSYRDSLVKRNKNLIVANVYFRLKKASYEEIERAKKEYYSHIEYRKTHHPMEYPSCGSVFKNITQPDQVRVIINKWPEVSSLSKEKWHGKVSMGYVINRLGFSRKQIGGAQVSKKHNNYIVNKNNATFNDIVSLINEIKESFFKEFNFYPEPEVEIVE